MLEAQFIVLQYPLFWYSAPSLLQRYLEETFQHGFSHGKTGDKLKGKKLVLSFTSGALASAYTKEGAMGYEIEDFLPCFKAACKLCQMEFAGFVYTGGVSYANRNSPELIEKQKEVSKDHATRLIKLLKTL